jgi:hypothetical protein
VKQMLKGHLNYFAVSGNHPSLWWYFNKVKRLWLASLKRRSQNGAPQLGEIHPVRHPLHGRLQRRQVLWTSFDTCRVGIWFTLSLILQPQEFKGAPKHIDYIDP